MRLQNFEDFLGEGEAVGAYEILHDIHPMFNYVKSEWRKLKNVELDSSLKDRIAQKAIEIFVKSGYQFGGVASNYIKETVDGASRMLNHIKKLKSAAKFFGEEIEMKEDYEELEISLRKTIAVASLLGAFVNNLAMCVTTILTHGSAVDKKKHHNEIVKAIFILNKLGLSKGFVNSYINELDTKDENYPLIVLRLRKYFPDAMHSRRGKDTGHVFGF